MSSIRSITIAAIVCILLPCIPINAQTAAIRQQIEAKYSLSKPTADRSDIVTAGDVIVLQKDHLTMCSTTSSLPAQNTYKDGKIQQSSFTKFRTFSLPTQTASVPSRSFVSGEKFWLTGIDIKDDGLVLTFLSDAFGDNRYYGALKFPFGKGGTPSPDQMLASVAEVIKVQPSDDAKGGDGKQSAPAKQAAPAPPAPAMAAIPPPPPPADAPAAAPPTIAIGQTRDQVTAMFGAPTKVVKLATKEIDYYPDMKVTFVKDKVTNIQ